MGSKGAARVLNKVKQLSLYLGEDESLITSAFQKDHSVLWEKKKKKGLMRGLKQLDQVIFKIFFPPQTFYDLFKEIVITR